MFRSRTFPEILVLLLIVSVATSFAGFVLETAMAAPDEARGTVVTIIDGDTMEVLLSASADTSSEVERIELADIDAPELERSGGIASRDFTSAVLMNRNVWMDLDDESLDGRTANGSLSCVLYLQGPYGQPVVPCFNRMLVDAGHAVVSNDTGNEFDPNDWWDGRSLGADDVSEGVSWFEEQVKELLRRLLG